MFNEKLNVHSKQAMLVCFLVKIRTYTFCVFYAFVFVYVIAIEFINPKVTVTNDTKKNKEIGARIHTTSSAFRSQYNWPRIQIDIFIMAVVIATLLYGAKS